MYLKQRHQTWWAIHDVPRSLQATLGRRLARSLGTHDRSKAKRLAAALWLHDWSRMLRSGDAPRADEAEAALYRHMLDKAESPEERQVLRAHITDVYSDRDQLVTSETERATNYRTFKLATGQLTPTMEHVDDWLAHSEDTDRTKASKRAVVTRFAGAFPYLQDITETKPVQVWLTELTRSERLSASTVVRYMAFMRGYWRYLQDAGRVEGNPLRDLRTPSIARKEQSWVPFAPAEVVSLLAAATAKGDQELADLITLGMWTGARIEELCSLPVADVDLGERQAFAIRDAKTAAGIRDVPIHPNLLPALQRLIGDRKEGYVLADLTAGNPNGDRADAIRKRFARLRTKAGFSDRHVFHSIRKTVGTLLENAGVMENVAADILGHEKPRITYGLYSGGATLDTKREALGKLSYPKPL